MEARRIICNPAASQRGKLDRIFPAKFKNTYNKLVMDTKSDNSYQEVEDTWPQYPE